MKRDKQYCAGCRENFYNGNNDMGIKECWNFKTAKVVTKYRIGWWTPQDRKENFVEVITHNCHCETGEYAFYDSLPSYLRADFHPLINKEVGKRKMI